LCLIWEFVVLIEGGDLAFADGFDFGGDRFDEREVKEMGHDFSFMFPGLSLGKSDGFSNHSFELAGQNSVFSEGFLVLMFVELFGKLWVDELNVWSFDKVANDNVILRPDLFVLIVAILVLFDAILGDGSNDSVEGSEFQA
jgi:hypothetical protein